MKTQKNSVFVIFFTVLAGFCFLTACEQPSNPKPKVVEKPTATPAGGNYTSAQTVTLAATTKEASIRYTLDGTTPTATSTLYSSAITIDETTTLKAIATKTGWTNSEILTEIYTLPGKAAQPTATPAGGSYATAQTVTLTSATAGASIFYTRDGSDPTTSSSLYYTPVSISGTTTLKAIAIKAGMINSDILTETYTITPPGQVIQPTATPAGGSYATAQTVTLTTATTGALIRYTLDGTDPTASSSLYLLSIPIRETTILKAIATRTGMTSSDILTETYTITTAGQPSASPPGGNYVLAQTVTLTTTTPGAEIHYTLDGTDPTASSPLYASPIAINDTTTLKAIAIRAGLSDSGILTAAYNIGYTVTLDAGGGTPAPVSPVTIKPGNTITQPPTMTKAWHTFGGWYTNSTYTVSAIFPITVNSNVNLYARWILNTLTSVADVSSYLASLPANTAANPANLTININLGSMTSTGSGWRQLIDAINTADRYVNLDLASCTMTGTSFNPDSNVATGKDKIISIILPTVATEIWDDYSGRGPLFRHFNNLKSISGAYVTGIGNYAFGTYDPDLDLGITYDACTSLQSVSFPQVTSIGSSAFRDCTSLQSVISFPQVTLIRERAFEGCTSLQSVNFSQVTSIGSFAFRDCTSLQSASFPQVEIIDSGAFFGCTSLQSVNVSASMNTDYYNNDIIYGYTGVLNPFAGCTSLTSFTLSGTGSLSVIENGKALVLNGTILCAYPSALGTVTLNTITSIGHKAFSGCTSLQSISLPQVTLIGERAFEGCTSLQSASFSQVTTINRFIFSNTGTTTLSITMGSAAPTLNSGIFDTISESKTVMVKIPIGATGYTPASSPFTGTAVTVSGTNTTTNWGNGLRGGGWTGTTWSGGSGTSSINQNISVIIERQ